MRLFRVQGKGIPGICRVILLYFRYRHRVPTLRDAQCHTTSNGAQLRMAFCPSFCYSFLSRLEKCRCRKELDSTWSWLVCFSAVFIIVLTLGISLNFGVLFPVLMDYFQESRERVGKFIVGPLLIIQHAL